MNESQAAVILHRGPGLNSCINLEASQELIEGLVNCRTYEEIILKEIRTTVSRLMESLIGLGNGATLDLHVDTAAKEFIQK